MPFVSSKFLRAARKAIATLEEAESVMSNMSGAGSGTLAEHLTSFKADYQYWVSEAAGLARELNERNQEVEVLKRRLRTLNKPD